ncbi:hypothetical protein [Arthrobacter tecti]
MPTREQDLVEPVSYKFQHIKTFFTMVTYHSAVTLAGSPGVASDHHKHTEVKVASHNDHGAVTI